MARALHRDRDLALLLRRVARDSAGQDLARLRQERAQQLRILVVDDDRAVDREPRDLLPAEGSLAHLPVALARLRAQSLLDRRRLAVLAVPVARIAPVPILPLAVVAFAHGPLLLASAPRWGARKRAAA